MRRAARIGGALMLVAGAATLAWALTVWLWQDPFTYLYTHREQDRLASSYERRAAQYGRRLPAIRRALTSDTRSTHSDARAAARREIALAARRYRLESRRGEAIGRIRIPRLGLNMILLNGADHDSLTRGPGRDLRSFMPGEGQLVYVAGHRTTYAAPFSHIDALRRGDRVTIELPYAAFEYAITRHVIVKANDLAVLRSRGYELLALQACHPRFFATHRYIVYGRPVRVIPRFGPAYSPVASGLAASR